MNAALAEQRAQRRAIIGPPERPIITDRRQEWQERLGRHRAGFTPRLGLWRVP